jgi:multicomponent Na+:H+ antiporter subunit G
VRIAGQTLIGLGSTLMVLAGLGVLRLPDTFARLQAGTKAASLGLAFLFAGTVLLEPSLPAAIKLTLAVLFQFITAPVAAHVIGRAAYRAGVPMWEGTVIDELGRDTPIETVED